MGSEVEVMQRYSNLDMVSKTLQVLRTAGLISPDGSAICRSDRSDEQTEPVQPFKLDQRLKPEIVADIMARYEAGEPSTAVAASYGLSKGSVIRLLREAGITIRRQGLTDDQIAEAAGLPNGGSQLCPVLRVSPWATTDLSDLRLSTEPGVSRRFSVVVDE